MIKHVVHFDDGFENKFDMIEEKYRKQVVQIVLHSIEFSKHKKKDSVYIKLPDGTHITIIIIFKDNTI